MYCKCANVSFCKPALTLWGLRTVCREEMYRNMYCAVFLVQLLMGEDGKGPAGKYCIVLNVKWWGANVNGCRPLNFQFCGVYQGTWICAVTCRAECIRLLAGRGMNICHVLSFLSTVIQPHTVYSKHKELLQSCYWKLKVNPTYGADLAHWTVIFVPVTHHLQCHQLYSKENVGV